MKKQTVWLVTLVSLMIVLSVYYINQSDGTSFLALNDDLEKNSSDDILDSISLEIEDKTEDVTTESEDGDLFSFIRLETSQERGGRLEQLETVLAQPDLETEKLWEAFEEIDQINRLETKEIISEETIKEKYGFNDVLVRTLEETVVVSVKGEVLSKETANEVMRDVYDEFGPLKVEVNHYPNE